MTFQTYSANQWLLINLATHFGKDKDVFADRLAFGRELFEYIAEATDLRHLKEILEPWLAQADVPEEFAACAIAIWDSFNNKPSGYVVGLDACNSGAQVISTGMRCMSGMINTGVIDTGIRPDLYSKLQENVEGLNLLRSVIKKACVPHLYGSEFTPKNILGAHYDAFLASAAKTMPMVEAARTILVDSWDENALFHEWELPDLFTAHIVSVVKQDYVGKFGGFSYTFLTEEIGTKSKGEQGTKSNSANVTHSFDAFILREIEARCSYSKKKYAKAIKRIRDYLDFDITYGKADEMLVKMEQHWKKNNITSVRAVEWCYEHGFEGVSKDYLEHVYELLITSMEHEPFAMKNIHDEFGCLPNYVNFMRRHYNDILAELYMSDWLPNVLEKLSGMRVHDYIEPIDPKVVEQIRNNNYAIN